MKKKFILRIVAIAAAVLFMGCSFASSETKEKEETKEADLENTQESSDEQTDYDIKSIPMSQKEQDETSEKLLEAVKTCETIFNQANKGGASNVVLEEAVVHEMVDALAQKELAVTCGGYDYNMHNYEEVDRSLKKAEAGEDAAAEFYVINTSGVFRYYQLQFENGDLQVVFASAVVDASLGPSIEQMEKIQAYQWEYTKKGWFIWEKALSRNQEMDMHIFCRILPLDDKCRQAAERYIMPIRYFCNNLFLVDWDENNMQSVAFNDLFDFLYPMKTGEKLQQEKYAQGIPKEEFEEVIRQHFELSQEEIEQYGAYDEEKGVYPWSAIDAWNRIQRPEPFPEVVKCIENQDGTVSVHVEAVYTVIGMDCAFRHVVTIREKEDGDWVYLGNQVDWENSYTVPSYKARKEFSGT